MNLAFVIKTLDSRGGGAERVLIQVTSELVRRGHQITLITFGRRAEPDFYPVDPAIRRAWLEVGDVQARSRVVDFLRQAQRLRGAIRDLAPDAAVGFMHSAYVPLALALAGSRVPVIASEHTVYDYFVDRPLDAITLRVTARRLAAITTISEAAGASFPQALAKRMVVLPNPVAPFSLHADPVGGRSKILLSIGRLDGPKDHRTLIQAFAQIAADHPDWILRIVGEGPLWNDLSKLVQALDLGDRVQLAGLVDNVETEYRSAQLFAMPSRYESFGLATAEALAAGLPAIGFADCSGTNELINQGVNGLLVRGPNRVAALARGMARLMGSPELRQRMGSAGPASVSQFALAVIGARWETLLSNAVAKRAQGARFS